MPEYTLEYPKDSMDALCSDLAGLPARCVADDIDTQENFYQACAYSNSITGKRIQVKHFTDKSYNGPRLSDFLHRLDVVFEAASRLLTEHYVDASEPVVTRQQAALLAARKRAQHALETRCKIQPIPLDQLANDANEQALVAIIQRATRIIQIFVVQALALAVPESTADVKRLAKALNALLAAEATITIQQGSPDFINFYSVNNVTRASVARVIGEAIPSTERTATISGQLPNFKQCGLGYLDARGYQTQFTGYRHSSYPPIRVQPAFKRQQETALMVNCMLKELAAQQRLKLTESGKDVPETLELNLATLTLLSPIALWEAVGATDVLFLGYQAEHRQLRESYDALMMVNEQVLDLTLDDGSKVKVRPHVNVLNAASNPLGIVTSKHWQAPLERKINAQGMLQFMEKVEQYLSTQRIPPFDVGVSAQLDAAVLDKKRTLVRLYGKLRQQLLDGDKTAYQSTLKQVNALKNTIDQQQQRLLSARKAQLLAKRTALGHHLHSIECQNIQDTPYAVAELYYQVLVMFCDGTVEPDQIGARFLLANQMMGTEVEFFCKSGEDRTGRMQNLLEELCEFKRQTGHYPRYDQATRALHADDAPIQLNIAKSVSEFSVCRDINNQNAIGARGLQIAEAIKKTLNVLGKKLVYVHFMNRLNVGLPNRSGDALAKMARSIYSMTRMRSLMERWLGVMDTKKRALVDEALQPLVANRWLEETTHNSEFSVKVTRIQDRSYTNELFTRPEAPLRTVIEARVLPTYRGIRLEANECICAEKPCRLEANPNRVILGKIEQLANGKVRETTRLPEGQSLCLEDNIALAKQQAMLLLRPPFSTKKGPIVLSGADPAQVARVHAAILYYKESHPLLRDLVILVRGSSPVPNRAGRWDWQSKHDHDFIDQHLGGAYTQSMDTHKNELRGFIQEQKNMKNLLSKPATDDVHCMPGQTVNKK